MPDNQPPVPERSVPPAPGLHQDASTSTPVKSQYPTPVKSQYQSILDSMTEEQKAAVRAYTNHYVQEAKSVAAAAELRKNNAVNPSANVKNNFAKRPGMFQLDVDMDIDLFIERFEDWVGPTVVEDSDKIRFFNSYLPDKLNRRLSQQPDVKARELSWEEFQERLKEAVMNIKQETGALARTKLRERKQLEGESLRDYADELYQLAKKAWPRVEDHAVREVMLKDILAHGAKVEEVAVFILQHADTKTFNTLVHDADKLESSYRVRAELKSKKDMEVNILRVQQQPTERGPDPYRPVQQQYYPSMQYGNGPRQSYYNDRDHRGTDRVRGGGGGGDPRRCWNCDRPGHIARNCFKRPSQQQTRYQNNHAPRDHSHTLGYQVYNDRWGQPMGNHHNHPDQHTTHNPQVPQTTSAPQGSEPQSARGSKN